MKLAIPLSGDSRMSDSDLSNAGVISNEHLSKNTLPKKLKNASLPKSDYKIHKFQMKSIKQKRLKDPHNQAI